MTEINMFRFFVFFLTFLFAFNFSNSQNLLELDEAIRLGLKNNFDIILSKTDSEISKANNTFGNAGMNPNINFNLNTNYAINNSHIEYSSGSITDKPSASVFNLSSSIALNWTIFDGFKMFTTKQKLDEIEKLGDINFKNQVQNSIYLIISNYLDIIKQNQLLKNVLEIKALSNERKIINENRFTSGLAAKTDFLLSQIDYNSQLENEITQNNNIKIAKRKLLELLNTDQYQDFEVEGGFLTNLIDSATTFDKIINNNLALKSLKKQLEISKLTINEAQSFNLSFVNLNAGYSLSISQSSTGLVEQNRNLGPYIGATLSLPIYQGGNISRQTQIAELNSIYIQFKYDDLKSQIINEFKNAFGNYQTQLKLLEIENQTQELTKENLNLSLERLRLSQATSLEVKEAQLQYENSLSRFVSINYNLKLAETQLKLLSGELAN